MDKELMESIRKLLKEELEPIKTEIKGLKKGQSSLKEQVQDLKTGQEEIKTMLKEMFQKNVKIRRII